MSQTTKLLLGFAQPSFLDVFRQLFESHGYDVIVATNGLSCVHALHQACPKVLVVDTDILWGGVDGVLAVMQDDEKLAEIPVVVTGEHKGISKKEASSIIARLRRPFRLPALVAAVKRASRAAQRRQIRTETSTLG